MAFTNLKSSNLRGFDYDEMGQVLSVTFNNGKTYTYDGVPYSVIDGLQKAPSAGKYFAQSIRNSFKFRP